MVAWWWYNEKDRSSCGEEIRVRVVVGRIECKLHTREERSTSGL